MLTFAAAVEEVEATGLPVVEGFAVKLAAAAEAAAVTAWLEARLPKHAWTAEEMPDGWRMVRSGSDAAPPPLGEAWEIIRDLKKLPGVERAEPLLITRSLVANGSDAQRAFALWGRVSNERLAQIQQASKPVHWSLLQMGVCDANGNGGAWALWKAKPGNANKTPGEGVVVAHPDTGYTKHARLLPHLLPQADNAALFGKNLVERNAPDALDPMTDRSFAQNPGHGTSTASVIASGDSPDTEPWGVAPGAKILPRRSHPTAIRLSSAAARAASGRAWRGRTSCWRSRCRAPRRRRRTATRSSRRRRTASSASRRAVGGRSSTYGQGLGDCFLLAFPRRGEPENPCYLVIDCGVAKSTPEKDVRIQKVVENIHAATGGHIDILAITHQHYDHISGFQDAWQEWKRIAVDAVYLPWTEAAAAQGEHAGTADFRKTLEEAAKKAMEKASELGILDAYPGFRAQADFLGVGLAADGGRLTGPADMDEAMTFARNLCPANIRYFDPGDVFHLPGTESHGYVLGPPRPEKVNPKGKRYVELLVDGAEGVMYSYAPLGMKVDAGKPGGVKAFALSDDHGLPAMASALLAADGFQRQGDEGFCPFAPDIRLDWDNAMAAPFFREHYGETKALGENGKWRRVDSDWLVGAATLALRAGDYTNNVSLVLAFDMPGSEKMLLFPGDAQVGNWLSWHTIDSWRFRDASTPALPPAANDEHTLMKNLLGRVVFYKVGHHGSHNATIMNDGLEAMTHKDLVAYLPVSVPVAQDLMGYCPMPFYPVVRALQRKTKGRVFLPNGQAVGPLPKGKSNKALLKQSGIVPAEEKLPEKRKDGKVLEGEVPLYLEVAIAS